MVLSEFEILDNFRTFMANVIEVVPRFRIIAMSVRTLLVEDQQEEVVVRTFVMQPWGDRGRMGEPSLVHMRREWMGLSEP